jgi:lipid-binding SYLF domain-containing protein
MTMNIKNLTCRKIYSLFFLLATFVASTSAIADSDDEAEKMALDRDIHAAISHLLETSEAARNLADSAQGALVFPNVTKAGFVVGIQYGDGALVKRRASGEGYYISKYYTLKSASYGLQAGIQTFGYVMALMTDTAVEQVETSSNWELGFGPTIVVVDKGTASTLTTETAQADIYAFTFGQSGLMAGLGIQGTKVSRMNK